MRLFAILSVIFCCNLMADPLTPFEASYDVTHGDSSLGGGKITLQKTADNQFQMGYVSDVGWFLLSDVRSEQSLFEVDDNTIIPKRYLLERSGSGPDFSAEVEFDAATGQIHARYKDRAADFPYKLPIYDNILYLVQLRLDVAAGKQQMAYDYIRKNKQRQLNYRVIGEEELETPFGTINTVKVERTRKSGSPKQTYTWLAKDHNYVIAQIQHYEDGELKAGLVLQQVSFSAE